MVIKLASENDWGYTRILGELKKLGIQLGRSTVVGILKEQGLDPGPKRGEGTWSEFVRRHAETLWACDFFSKKVWTLGGLKDVFVLFFINIKTRRVHIAGLTTNPDNQWMVQQASGMSTFFAQQPVPPKHLVMDLDTNFTADFRKSLENAGLKMIRVGPRQPNMNAFAEAASILSIREECLDHFICFGSEHLHYIVKEFQNILPTNSGLINPWTIGQFPKPNPDTPAVLPFPNRRTEMP